MGSSTGSIRMESSPPCTFAPDIRAESKVPAIAMPYVPPSRVRRNAGHEATAMSMSTRYIGTMSSESTNSRTAMKSPLPKSTACELP